jgi:hypothetical protein
MYNNSESNENVLEKYGRDITECVKKIKLIRSLEEMMK